MFKNMEKFLISLKEIFIKNNLTVSTGESCTGGLISSFLTDIDGASDFIQQCFVTYSPKAKQRFLNVNPKTIEQYGVVSSEVAQQMTCGLLDYADIGIATTGYAAPNSGDENNKGGCVYIGLGFNKKGNKIIRTFKYQSPCKTRVDIKKDFAKKAFEELIIFLKNNI